ncbi:DUF4142 domain-containing protein [Halopseudomonas nanhaiensis]|uniref:DUF4142 domain-containing protein n=1 Tax=Halopseudomonas nanhaiensis TaxID=2830842 RepID=UPI001CBF53E7|nr:DUF4142 domain-containing protein [Halopseudomonas nanhaiensis]UAW97507.1 DUF4142 domain-containing protein [Halopseudomonas nanhaiensis]
MKTAHMFKTGALAVAMSLAASSAWAMDAEEFIDSAAEKGFAEIETAKLAQERGQSEEVNKFAEKMIEDHRSSNEELKEMAQEKNLEFPDDATLMDRGKAMILKLREGENFDQAYANNQVVAHEQTIEIYEVASQELQDEELKEWASDQLEMLREHYGEAKQLQTQTGAEGDSDS